MTRRWSARRGSAFNLEIHHGSTPRPNPHRRADRPPSARGPHPRGDAARPALRPQLLSDHSQTAYVVKEVRRRLGLAPERQPKKIPYVGKGGRGAVFLSQRGDAFTPRRIEQIVGEAARSAKIVPDQVI